MFSAFIEYLIHLLNKIINFVVNTIGQVLFSLIHVIREFLEFLRGSKHKWAIPHCTPSYIFIRETERVDPDSEDGDLASEAEHLAKRNDPEANARAEAHAGVKRKLGIDPADSSKEEILKELQTGADNEFKIRKADRDERNDMVDIAGRRAGDGGPSPSVSPIRESSDHLNSEKEKKEFLDDAAANYLSKNPNSTSEDAEVHARKRYQTEVEDKIYETNSPSDSGNLASTESSPRAPKRFKQDSSDITNDTEPYDWGSEES